MIDLFDVRGKCAVVTGGSRGIGFMIARGLVDAGVTVYISSRNAEACKIVAKELSEIGECLAVPADLSSRGGCESLAAQLEHLDRIDLLVNNAGAIWNEPIETFPPSAWDKVLDLNLKAPFFLVQLLLGQLEQASTPDDPARVINI